MGLRLWWTRVSGLPARWLMRFLSRREPHRDYDGIRVMVGDHWLAPSGEVFFERTRTALAAAAAGAPRAYVKFRKDIQQILLWGETEEAPYHRFQLAAVVAPSIALQADTASYAAWLLYASGLPHGREEARIRSEELLGSFEPDQGRRIREWLVERTERQP
jgi:hypothetical protein